MVISGQPPVFLQLFHSCTRLLNYEYANNFLTREENLLTRVVYSPEGDFTLKPPPEQALADMGISDDDVAITII